VATAIEKGKLTSPEALGNLVLFGVLIADLLMRFLSPVLHLLVVLLDIRALGRRRVLVQDLGSRTFY
jgi:hypothetical protein